MNQSRHNQERDDGYQNTGRGSRSFQNRPNGPAQIHPNLNPNYQNPVDLVRNYNRNRQHEPEENIYERLDNDDDDDGRNREVAGNEPVAPNNQNNIENHMYERIDDRHSSGGRSHSRSYKYHLLNHMPGPSFLSDMDYRNLNQYDQPRNIYLDPSRLSNRLSQNRLGRLGRNCFSTENIAYASTRRSYPLLGYNCMCPFCRRLDTRYVCHHCHNLHNRFRYQDGFNTGSMGSSRHYIYQLSRNCRCPFCRGEYSYVKLPISTCRPTESSRIECHCRNPNNCTCRNILLPNSNSAIRIARYLDWINRGGPSVTNPLYATIHIGRIDRACTSALDTTAAGSNSSNSSDPVASTSNPTPSTSSSNEPCTSSNLRSIFPPCNPSNSNGSVCSLTRSTERQHICDDSCIRNHSGNVAGVCQFVSRCERAGCNHGRLSVHWWFVNKWLPPWNTHNSDRNTDAVPPMEEEPRDQQESDSDGP